MALDRQSTKSLSKITILYCSKLYTVLFAEWILNMSMCIGREDTDERSLFIYVMWKRLQCTCDQDARGLVRSPDQALDKTNTALIRWQTDILLYPSLIRKRAKETRIDSCPPLDEWNGTAAAHNLCLPGLNSQHVVRKDCTCTYWTDQYTWKRCKYIGLGSVIIIVAKATAHTRPVLIFLFYLFFHFL